MGAAAEARARRRAGIAAMDTGNVSGRGTWSDHPALEDLVLDPALQCRVQVDPEVVAEYAEAMGSGVEFPPVEAMLCNGQLLVVDGWHRVHAARKAGLVELAAEVTRGTRGDAVLRAVGANRGHGLRRSAADKRRAVRMMLQNPDWTKLSTRQLGEMAGVSHAFVGQVRQHYGLLGGEVLTEERIEEVDGDLPAEWQQLVDGANGWQRPELFKARRARSLAGLAKAIDVTRHVNDAGLLAIDLRLRELGTEPWPWPEDTAEERARRTKSLEHMDDVEAALASSDCPDPVGLFKVWAWARKGNRLNEYDADRAAQVFAGRPALVAAARARGDEIRAKRDEEPHQQAKAIIASDRAAIPDLVAAADPDVWVELCRGWRLREAAEVRAAVREGLERTDAAVVACADPRCDGWALRGQSCTVCGSYQPEVAKLVERTLEAAGQLVRAGMTLSVAGVRVDRDTARGLLALRKWASLDAPAVQAWLASAPEEVRAELAAMVEP